ncbi:MAG: glycosyl hydrolase 53 family protein [Chitinophagaceae bacterium]|nr:glycosyl hydrolase 53 family protein [Chitinophagaceae bacterium]
MYEASFFKSQYFFLLLAGNVSCSKSTTPNPVPPVPAPALFAKGADIGWLSQMEHDGVKFYNMAGAQQDCIQLLKDKGINSIRLRVWVNPTQGWCSPDDVTAQAVRAKNKGMRIMIDFHYSDTWADPGHQYKPAVWAALSFADMINALATHTKAVMNQLKLAGVTPEWVQVGNETNDGMLWEEGRASAHMAQYAALVKAGYEAVKEVSSSSKVIVHISNGADNGLFRWNLDGLKNNGAKWDVIGMSLYPTVAGWQAATTQCLANMNDMITRFGSEIMISEVGMPADQPAVCKAFLKDIIAKNKSLPGNKGLGVFYWEPECHNNWQGYGLGAFDSSGKPTIAMDAFNEL